MLANVYEWAYSRKMPLNLHLHLYTKTLFFAGSIDFIYTVVKEVNE